MVCNPHHKSIMIILPVRSTMKIKIMIITIISVDSLILLIPSKEIIMIITIISFLFCYCLFLGISNPDSHFLILIFHLSFLFFNSSSPFFLLLAARCWAFRLRPVRPAAQPAHHEPVRCRRRSGCRYLPVPAALSETL